jgi:citronellol/citronellal dehydrogenase
MSLAGKTIFISGGSRGIGLAIALRAARDGANIALAAKTAEPHAKLEGTIYTAAEQIDKAGGRALPLMVDIRDEERVAEAVRETADKFGGIDILINNASAIRTTGTLDTPVRRYDLMHGVNGRGTFVCSQACLPHLMKAENPHILTISPPLTHDAKWFAPHAPYSIAKYTMSLFTLALAGIRRTRDSGELALAPHGYRDRSCALRARRRGDDVWRAHARDRGRRSPCDPDIAGSAVDRQVLFG